MASPIYLLSIIVPAHIVAIPDTFISHMVIIHNGFIIYVVAISIDFILHSVIICNGLYLYSCYL
jgi:hypothetical protein